MPPSPPPAFRSDSAPQPLRLRPEIAELASLNDYIETFALAHDLPAADTNAISLAAEELFANTIGHSDPAASLIEFSLACEGPAITAVYADDAATFDPTAYPEADTTLPLDQRPVGGLGIHFIRRTMQAFAYQRVGGRNQITFGRAVTRKPS
jgi:serine/threonine-protein kinase RsbW